MSLAQTERGLLARIGFFLCRDGWVPEAEAVFDGLAASDPEKPGPAVGQALCLTIKGEPDRAVALLDKRLAAGGGEIAPALMLYKLTALGMAGRLDEARRLRDAMKADGLGGAVATADALLDDLKRIDAGKGNA